MPFPSPCSTYQLVSQTHTLGFIKTDMKLAAGSDYCPVASHVVLTELYILCWMELSRCKLSPTLATAHYSSPNNDIGLVAQCELGRYVKLGCWLFEAVWWKFSHRPDNHATAGGVKWLPASDTAGYSLRQTKLTPVSLISVVVLHCYQIKKQHYCHILILKTAVYP